MKNIFDKLYGCFLLSCWLCLYTFISNFYSMKKALFLPNHLNIIDLFFLYSSRKKKLLPTQLLLLFFNLAYFWTTQNIIPSSAKQTPLSLKYSQPTLYTVYFQHIYLSVGKLTQMADWMKKENGLESGQIFFHIKWPTQTKNNDTQNVE